MNVSSWFFTELNNQNDINLDNCLSSDESLFMSDEIGSSEEFSVYSENIISDEEQFVYQPTDYELAEQQQQFPPYFLPFPFCFDYLNIKSPVSDLEFVFESFTSNETYNLDPNDLINDLSSCPEILDPKEKAQNNKNLREKKKRKTTPKEGVQYFRKSAANKIPFSTNDIKVNTLKAEILDSNHNVLKCTGECKSSKGIFEIKYKDSLQKTRIFRFCGCPSVIRGNQRKGERYIRYTYETKADNQIETKIFPIDFNHPINTEKSSYVNASKVQKN